MRALPVRKKKGKQMKSREWGTAERRRLLTEGISRFDAARLWCAQAGSRPLGSAGLFAAEGIGADLNGGTEAACVRRLRRR